VADVAFLLAYYELIQRQQQNRLQGKTCEIATQIAAVFLQLGAPSETADEDSFVCCTSQVCVNCRQSGPRHELHLRLCAQTRSPTHMTK
jgi:hypothetical protein